MARPVSFAAAAASSRVVARIANVGLATMSSSRDCTAAERPMTCDLTQHPAAWLPAAETAAAADRCMSSSRQDKRRQVYVNLAYPVDFCLNLYPACIINVILFH